MGLYTMYTPKHAYPAEFISVRRASWWPRVVLQGNNAVSSPSVASVSGEMETRFPQRTRAASRHELARSLSLRENGWNMRQACAMVEMMYSCYSGFSA